MHTVTMRKLRGNPRRASNRRPRRRRKAPALRTGIAKSMSKKKHAEHANHERWLVSYADFITLLFAFFVVMFATSQTDKAKAKQVSDSVREALENGGVSAAVHEIMGGTVDEKGKGNAQMRGPGGAAKNEKKEVKPRPDEAELLPSLEYLNSQLR